MRHRQDWFLKGAVLALALGTASLTVLSWHWSMTALSAVLLIYLSKGLRRSPKKSLDRSGATACPEQPNPSPTAESGQM